MQDFDLSAQIHVLIVHGPGHKRLKSWWTEYHFMRAHLVIFKDGRSQRKNTSSLALLFELNVHSIYIFRYAPLRIIFVENDYLICTHTIKIPIHVFSSFDI